MRMVLEEGLVCLTEGYFRTGYSFCAHLRQRRKGVSWHGSQRVVDGMTGLGHDFASSCIFVVVM